jgi:hypothetical protein
MRGSSPLAYAWRRPFLIQSKRHRQYKQKEDLPDAGMSASGTQKAEILKPPINVRFWE